MTGQKLITISQFFVKVFYCQLKLVLYPVRTDPELQTRNQRAMQVPQFCARADLHFCELTSGILRKEEFVPTLDNWSFWVPLQKFELQAGTTGLNFLARTKLRAPISRV